MSRIGKNPVTIPSGVTVEVKGNVVTVKGKLGELTQEFDVVDVKVEEGQVVVERPSDAKDHKIAQTQWIHISTVLIWRYIISD